MRWNIDFNMQYWAALKSTIDTGVDQFNERTGQNIKVHDGPITFTIDMADCKLPVPSNRRYALYVPAAEVAWMLSGEKSMEWLSSHTKIWDQFADEDGNMETAYGYRWRHAFGRDQVDETIQALSTEPSSRQVIMTAWDPGSDGLMGEKKKNIPCPVMFILNIIGGHLNGHVIIRSSDLFVGLPYDVMTYALLLDALATELELPMGHLSFYLAHPHIYEDHIQFIDFKTWKPYPTQNAPPLPNESVDEIYWKPNIYMEHIHRLYDDCSISTHPYAPRPEVFP